MRLEFSPKAVSTADISWPPPPLQKQSVRAVELRVPQAVAGVSGAYQVAVGNELSIFLTYKLDLSYAPFDVDLLLM